MKDKTEEIVFSVFWCQEKFAKLLEEKCQEKKLVQNVNCKLLKNAEKKPGVNFNNQI